MKPLLDHIDQMTLTRDRDSVDLQLLVAVLDLLPSVRSLCLWRVLGDSAPAHRTDGLLWRRCAACHRDDRTGDASTSSPPLSGAELTPSADLPKHAASLLSHGVQQWQTPDTAWAVIPVGTGPDADGVLELATVVPLDDAALQLVHGLVRLHRNVLGLLDYSERDTLTRLLNRKSFDDTFLKATALEAERVYAPDSTLEAERRQAGERRHWLGVVDVDHFKQVNDRYGHLMGDEVLVAMGRIMRTSLRHDDRLYRFGGEEFVVLLTAPDDATAGEVLDRLRSNIAAAEFPAIGRITASSGYSDVRPGDTPQAAFDRADRAVYHAKQTGRNRVCSFAALVADGSQVAHPGVGGVELF